MNQIDIIITQPNGNRVPMQNRHMATFVTQARQNWGLNAEDTVDITVESAVPQTFDIGDQITIFGRDYKLNRLPSVKKTGLRQFQYDMQFEGVQYDLMRASYDVTIDTTNNKLQDVLGDSLTGNLKRFMTVLVANANRVFPGKWALGVCPETIGDKTLTFGESDNCLSVLQNLCNESNFKVEFEIVNSAGVYTINLYERVGQTLPYRFEYGKGKGLYELNRQNVSSANIVTRLKVYGSTENITHKYRADRLCLPGKSKGQSYIEKPEMVAKYGIYEGRKHFDDVKPTFTGKVETKVDEYSFIDTSFPFDLNAKNEQGETLYLINGVTAKIHFNTGNLAGYEFEVKSYDHATHKFTLKKLTDDRGDVFPSETSQAFQFAVHNEYKVLDIAYSPEIEAAAEAKLEETANEYYDQNCQPKVQYGLSVTKEYLENLVGGKDTVVNVFAPGDYLHIVDADIAVDKTIRIKSFNRNVLDPYEYTLTVSDSITNSSIANRVISELIELEKIVTINNLKDPSRARSNWRTSQELLNMMFDVEGNYYTDKIKPNSIDTLALSVGAKSMQFVLTNTVFEPNNHGDANAVTWKGGVLTHYAIEENIRSWTMASYYTVLTSNIPYYLYAKCEKKGTAGSFVFSTEQIAVDADANHYHFLVGVISSIDPDFKVRSLSLMYGSTTVNGRHIKTGCIASADGNTYFDLDNGEIGGNITFTSNGEKKNLSDIQTQLDDAVEQIDGKVECWFQTTNPAIAWTTDEEKKKHIGDIWYHVAYKEMYYYSSDCAWVLVEDAKANAAFNAASEAQTAANGKMQVYTSTPTPPYKVGDLWANGNDLLKCVTGRTKTETYNVNDWSSFGYDNTKTTIDGGLVTSGTIQVAGDLQTILAGITGQGTSDDSIRFWAGASQENRGTAPFRVAQDGSVVMTKANVEGTINAKEGFIGGFELATGRIGVDGGLNASGFTLGGDYIKYSNSRQRAVIGTNTFPPSLGYPCMASFEYTDTDSYGNSAIALYAKCRPAVASYFHRQQAFYCDGNIFEVGGKVQFYDNYIGQAYTYIIQEYIGITHHFHFTSVPTSAGVNVYLPTKAQIEKAAGKSNVFCDIHISCAASMSYTLWLYPGSGTTIYNHKNEVQKYVELNSCDIITLRYYNGTYTTVHINW